jgi:hypothetical protein
MNTWTTSMLRSTTIGFATIALALGFTSACTVDPKAPGVGSGDGIGSQGEGPGTEEGDGDGDPSTSNGDGDADPTEAGDGDGDGDPGDEGDDSQTKFDLAGIPDGSTNGGCLAPSHDPCDEDNDPWHALGINCDGEWEVTTTYTGHVQALYVHTGQLGTYMPATYPPLEGDKMVIMSSGIAQQMTIPGQYASTANPGNDPMVLPAPLTPTPVDVGLMTDCIEDPDLIGTGDCSNTIKEQWSQGNGAYDYAELRITGEVPGGATGFSYNLAFFSTEYPAFYHSSFNDMYIAWLESEVWTGNVSFDELGAPISLNAVSSTTRTRPISSTVQDRAWRPSCKARPCRATQGPSGSRRAPASSRARTSRSCSRSSISATTSSTASCSSTTSRGTAKAAHQ